MCIITALKYFQTFIITNIDTPKLKSCNKIIQTYYNFPRLPRRYFRFRFKKMNELINSWINLNSDYKISWNTENNYFACLKNRKKLNRLSIVQTVIWPWWNPIWWGKNIKIMNHVIDLPFHWVSYRCDAVSLGTAYCLLFPYLCRFIYHHYNKTIIYYFIDLTIHIIFDLPWCLILFILFLIIVFLSLMDKWTVCSPVPGSYYAETSSDR